MNDGHCLPSWPIRIQPWLSICRGKDTPEYQRYIQDKFMGAVNQRRNIKAKKSDYWFHTQFLTKNGSILPRSTLQHQLLIPRKLFLQKSIYCVSESGFDRSIWQIKCNNVAFRNLQFYVGLFGKILLKCASVRLMNPFI